MSGPLRTGSRGKGHSPASGATSDPQRTLVLFGEVDGVRDGCRHYRILTASLFITSIDNEEGDKQYADDSAGSAQAEGRGGRQRPTDPDHFSATSPMREVRRSGEKGSAVPWPASGSHTSAVHLIGCVLPWNSGRGRL